MGIDPHQSTIRFAQAGMIVFTVLVIGPGIAAGLTALGAGRAAGSALRLLVPALGGCAAGVLAGSALDGGRRAVVGAGAALAGAGAALTWLLVQLQGLSSFEPALTVVSFSVVGFAAVFSAAGAVLALPLGEGLGLVTSTGVTFGLTGAVGGLFAVLPFLLVKMGMMPESATARGALLFGSLAAAIMLPHVVGGAMLSARLDERHDR